MFYVHMVVKGSEASFPKHFQRCCIQISFHHDHQRVRRYRKGIISFMSLDFSQEKLNYPCFSPQKQVQISHSFTTHSQIHVKKMMSLHTQKSLIMAQKRRSPTEGTRFVSHLRRQRFLPHLYSLKPFPNLLFLFLWMVFRLRLRNNLMHELPSGSLSVSLLGKDDICILE